MSVTTSAANSAVIYEVQQSIAVLTLNRPESLNALDPAMIDALLTASEQAAADPAVRAVILCGAGKHFMAGGDLAWFREQTALEEADCRARFVEVIGRVHASVENFRRMRKPVIAAVHGAVAGFGLSLMLAADLALAADDAYFTLAYSNIALSPDGGGTWSLPRHVGLKRAMEIALLGERFSAERAYELGLVNRLVPPGELAGEAMKLARRLANGPSLALAHTKALLNSAFEHSLEEQLRREQVNFADCAAHPDFAEGLAAFFERRPPSYQRD